MKIIEENQGFALIGHPTDTTRATVVGIDRQAGQVVSALPSDEPSDGGHWVSAITPSGVLYVSSWVTRAHARRVFRALVAECDELDACRI